MELPRYRHTFIDTNDVVAQCLARDVRQLVRTNGRHLVPILEAQHSVYMHAQQVALDTRATGLAHHQSSCWRYLQFCTRLPAGVFTGCTCRGTRACTCVRVHVAVWYGCNL